MLNINTLHYKDTPNVPMILCNDGLGRTAILITAAIIKRKIQSGSINKNNIIDKLSELILELRNQRGEKFIPDVFHLQLLAKYAFSILHSYSSPKGIDAKANVKPLTNSERKAPIKQKALPPFISAEQFEDYSTFRSVYVPYLNNWSNNNVTLNP